MVELYLFIAVALYCYVVWFLKYKYESNTRPKIDGFSLAMFIIFCLFWIVTIPCLLVGFGFSSLAKWISK